MAVDDHRMNYIIPSRHKDHRRACALFAFPVAEPDQPRSVNIIRKADHFIWTIDTAQELLAFLGDSFPQIDVRSIVTAEEAGDFVKLEPGSFPKPQYSCHLHACIGPPDRPVHCLLIGDAAHAFPPDLGMGVNSALEDLEVLACILSCQPQLGKALPAYEKAKLPDSAALTRLVQKTFPEQYNHRPVRMLIWILGFFTRRGLNRIAPWLVDKPAFLLTQDPNLSFSEMESRKKRTDLAVRSLGVLSLIAFIWLIVRLF